MTAYKVPREEISFLVEKVMRIGSLDHIALFSQATPALIEGLVDEAGKLIEDRLVPLSQASDEGCKFDKGTVTTPPGYKEFYREFRDAGWTSICQSPDLGGSGLPYLVAKIVDEMTCSGGLAFALYPSLTAGCFEAIDACADHAIAKPYLEKLATGQWCGTMCLTEPQAGSDLGAIRTRATPQPDGTWRIDGNKIFISSGEHDLTDNIVHFVLARTPDAPEGTRGLSTFIVPKFLPDEDGSPGKRNSVVCTSIEHKMGLRGSATASLSFEASTGWLAGKLHTGIQNMFVMMNLARILVGFQGLGLCELATQNAINYARDRKQGVGVSGASEIADHPDVKRMLLHMKAITEGARALAYDTALQVDLSRHHPTTEGRQVAQDLVELYTPIVKFLCTDSAFELGSLAVQVYGGHGYIAEHGIEKIIRDAKILALYEGTNGIQAMDLVRRKIRIDRGRLAKGFFEAAWKLVGDCPVDFHPFCAPLGTALAALEAATAQMQSQTMSMEVAGFGATDYMRAFSLVCLGHQWLRMLLALDDSVEAGFATAKKATAEYFFTRQLPFVEILCANATKSATPFTSLSPALL